jgi:hypothetical protein
MAHWFDQLAQPQTRRTAVKSAALAGAALLLPIGRTSSALATVEEPCYVDCLKEAKAVFDVDDAACAKQFGAASYAEIAPGVGGLLKSLRRERWLGCRAVASCRWHQTIIDCRFKPECGDREKYPGGNAPATRPPDGGCGEGYVLCDGYCCGTAYAFCQGCNGKGICCRINGNCCPGGG